MPIFTASAENAALNAINVDTLSLHSAYDAAGGNELIGGSPAYARLTVAFGAPINGKRAMVSSPSFDVPAGATVAWVGMWSGSTLLGLPPAGGDTLRPFSLTDLATGNITCAGHGFPLNGTLVTWAGSTGVLPIGISEGTVYYVVSASADSLQIAAAPNGAAIVPTSSGNGFLQTILPTIFTSQGKFPLTSLVLDARAA